MCDEPAACAECGASGRFGTCAMLFHRLLALDHQRLQPWGRFHGLNLVCFLLQHPTQTSAAEADGQWPLVSSYLSGGIDALHRLEADRVASSRRGGKPWIGVDPAPRRTSSPVFTIEDVSVDGSFPASGYEGRMSAWASSIARERAPDDVVRRFAGDLTDGDRHPG